MGMLRNMKFINVMFGGVMYSGERQNVYIGDAL